MSDFVDLVDLASERLGSRVIAANDDFFAPKEALIHEAAPVFVEGKYTDRGKWMDGWETRRRRTPGHDWCIVRLGLPGSVAGVVVDTSFFTGNFPESCSIDASAAGEAAGPSLETSANWVEILPRSALRGGTRNLFTVNRSERFTHVRLNIFPDGGVARLRVHGTVVPDWSVLAGRAEIDLAALDHGGLVVGASDMYFGSRHNLIRPDPPRGMSDAWETRRRRAPGHDWVIVRLGARGLVRHVEVDTTYFKGNAPGECSLDVLDLADGRAVESVREEEWTNVLPTTAVRADARNRFDLASGSPATHVRLNIFPDGGVARLRVFGDPDRTA